MHAKVSSFFILLTPPTHPWIPVPKIYPIGIACLFFFSTFFVQPQRTNNENHLTLSLSSGYHLLIDSRCSCRLLLTSFMFFFFLSREKKKSY